MADQDFFNDGEQEVQEVPEKFKVNEKEYSQEDLNRLVGLGETAAELEDKWNTKIDRLYPEYTKKTQKLSEYEQKMAELEKEREAQVQTKAKEGEELSPEEQAQVIKQELSKYGVVTKEDIYQFIANYDAVKDLNRDIDGLISEAKEAGKPVTSRDDLLGYMDEQGIKNPNAAYKLMFEDQLKDWEKKQIDSLKSPGLETESASTAGSKSPAPVKVTRDNLGEMLRQALDE